MVSQIKVNEIIKQSGSSITIGESGDTVTIPSGATLNSAGTNTLSGIANSPAFSSYASSGTQGTVGDNTWTKVILNLENYDTDSAYDTSTGRFTVPSGGAGKYVFTFQCYMYPSAVGPSMAYRLYINGSGQGGMTSAIDLGSNNLSTVAIPATSMTANLSEGDYVEFYVKGNTGSGNNVIADMRFGGFRLLGI
tara:strand:- start:47 stop:625 length:579 start_codon:yes stop_codon:yes gene_type:complete